MQVGSHVLELQMLKLSMQLLFLKWVSLNGIKPSRFRPNVWLFKEKIHYRALGAAPMKHHFNCAPVCAVLPQFRARGQHRVRQDAVTLGAKQTELQKGAGHVQGGPFFSLSCLNIPLQVLRNVNAIALCG